MHPRRFGLLLILGAVASCHRTTSPTTTPIEQDDEETMSAASCMYGPPGGLYGFTINSTEGWPAEAETASIAFDAATAAREADDHLAAARHYLECGRAYRTIADSYSQLDHVRENAETCYSAASVEWAQADRFEAEGRAALEQAVTDDPRMAEYLRELLASAPADCGS